MKRIATAILATVIASSAQAATYLVEPMLCGGRIEKRPGEIHPDYSKILMKFVSFKSKRTDGQWVDSLSVSNDYFGPNEPIDYDTEHFGEEWFMGPLSISGKQVSRKSLSGRNDDLNLKIKNSIRQNGKRIDTLEGTYAPNKSGSYVYKLNCKATVVTEPSRRDDNTAQH